MIESSYKPFPSWREWLENAKYVGNDGMAEYFVKYAPTDLQPIDKLIQDAEAHANKENGFE